MSELALIIDFLTEHGFRLTFDRESRPAFLPGIFISGMTLMIDPSKLKFPGDILHEAGHVAITPSIFRPHLRGDVCQSISPLYDTYTKNHPSFTLDQDGIKEDMVHRGMIQAGETEAQAWSYAASLAAGIPPESVFHPGAFTDGGEEDAVLMFSMRGHYGVHGLAAGGMTTTRTFPRMIRWLQV